MDRKGWLGLVLLVTLVAAGFWLWQQRSQPRVQARVQGPVAAASSSGYARATGPRAFDFPADYGPHPDFQTEWWYYTGNLDTAEGRHFGYQLTFFRRAVTPPADRVARASAWTADQVIMAHFALTDVQGKQFYAFERLERAGAGLAGAQAEPFAVWLNDWRVQAETPAAARFTMQAAAEGVAIDFTLTSRKNVVLQGDRGYSQKGPDPGNASYYTSLTRLETEGTLTVSGETYAVTGWSWQDHEYSTSALAADQIGWDWFALQLDDNSELKVFHIRRADGSVDPFSAGSFVDAAGNVTPLTRDDFEISVDRTWRSPRSDAPYPARWQVTVPRLNLRVELTPWLADQELNVSYSYWEGAVQIAGTRNGVAVRGNGYVEMTGYAGSMQGQF